MRGNHLIREARRRAGMTQAEVAARVGTTQSAIARLERGSGNPTLERISELVAACELDVEIRLVPQDEGTWEQIRSNGLLSPDERVAKVLGALRLARRLSAAGAAARA